MISGLFIIVIGFVFKYSKWFQLIANYKTTKQGTIQFDMDRVASLFLKVSIYTGILMIFGELISDYLENGMIFWISSWTALSTGIGYFLFRVNSVEYKHE